VKTRSRPNIGVTAATERVSYGVWKEIPAIISPARYVEAVQRAGGRPVLLPPDPEGSGALSEGLSTKRRGECILEMP
jgi:gamma-glutamyl-gamma-aminobutyrate hydrolase PuuD